MAYSAVTKIDVQANQKQAVSARLASPDEAWAPLRFDELADIVQEFVRAREWDRFHTPRDLTLALTGEVGELCELFQWKTEESCAVGLPGATTMMGMQSKHLHSATNICVFTPCCTLFVSEWKEESVALVAQELSDVSIYLVRLAAICGFDFATVFTNKMNKNRAKYDPALVANGGRAAYLRVKAAHRAARGLQEGTTGWQRLRETLHSTPGVLWTLGSMLVGGIAALGVQRLLTMKMVK